MKQIFKQPRLIRFSYLLLLVLIALSGCTKTTVTPEKKEDPKREEEHEIGDYFFQFKLDGVLVRFAAPDPVATVDAVYNTSVIDIGEPYHVTYQRNLFINAIKSTSPIVAVLYIGLAQDSHIEEKGTFIPVSQIPIEGGRTYISKDSRDGFCIAQINVLGKKNRVEVTLTEFNLAENYVKGTFTGSWVYNPHKIEEGSFYVPLLNQGEIKPGD